MPLDPNIILQGKTPEIQSPLDAMSKVMAYKELSNRSQLSGIQTQNAQREFQDQSAMRQAYANNTQIDPNGNAVLNRTGFMKDLSQSAPHLVPQAQANIVQMDNQRMKAALEHISIGAQILGGVSDQDSYDKARQVAVQMGGDVSNWPAQFNQSTVNLMRAQALTVKDQLEAQAKQRGLDIQEKEANIKTQQLGLELRKYGGSNVQETLQSLQSARGNPAVQQAEKDVYSAQKINSLANQVTDLNKLTPQQIDLFSHELLKMASGGQGTEEELKSLKPGTPAYGLAEIYQKVKNAPSPAKAGLFIKQGLDYANSISNDAKGLLKQNYQGIIESKKPYLPADSYKTLSDQFLGRLNGTVEPGSNWSLDGAAPAAKTGAKTKDVLSFGEWQAQQKQAAKK